MLFTFLLVVQAVIAFVLVAVILMQRSEGGGLGMGGSPSGLMSARGAGDFLTRITAVLAVAFVGLSIVLAALAATQHRGQGIDTSLVGKTGTADLQAPAQTGDPLAGAANQAAPASDQTVPLQ